MSSPVRTRTMLCALLCTLSPVLASAQRDTSSSSSSVALVADNFFGMQAGLSLNLPVASRQVHAYGTIFKAGFLGNGAGQNPWTEIGVGVPVTTGEWTITPRIGAVFGQLLSGGTGNTGRALAGEGIVPNVTVSRSGAFHVDAFAAYYRSTRDQGTQVDFFHFNATAGVPVAKNVIAGGLIEQLDSRRVVGATTVFRWIGPYAQIGAPGKTALRASAGWNTASARGDFYKVSMLLPLP